MPYAMSPLISPRALLRERDAALDAVGRQLGIASWPDIPVHWNRRLRRAGRAAVDSTGARFDAAEIELSTPYFEVYPNDLRGILIHEAVHVGLAYVGRPFGHTREFRDVCVAAGGLLHSRWLPGRIYLYRCPVCRAIHERRRRASDSRWCADCADALQSEHARNGGRRGGSRQDPYAPERALVLVQTAFLGPEEAYKRERPACEGDPSGSTTHHAPPPRDLHP